MNVSSKLPFLTQVDSLGLRRGKEKGFKTGCGVAKIFPSRADLGVPQVAGIINLPELVPHEKDSILLATQKKFTSPPDSPNWGADQERCTET